MAFTIYTVSDPATVGAALQGMAMFFGQEGWVGSAIKTGLMLSLLFILAQGVTRNGLRLDTMLLQLLVVWAMFMPRTTVTVEQFDNAAPPRVVDEVPYAIALPASIAGAFALYMTNKIEAVMVNVDGDYLSISGGAHPFTPARALMSITMCPSDPMGCVDQNLVETMRLAARFCAGRELSNVDFRVKSDVLGAFADTMTLQAQVVVYDAANPYIPGGGGGRVASCPESAAHLRAVSEAERAGTGSISKAMSGLANRSEIKRYNAIARAQDNTERTWDEALNDINKLRDSNSKMDSLAFANVTLYSLADTMKYSASAPIDQAITLRRDSSLFEWAKAEAHQSMLVSTTAPKFMDILFFVFIASTPIVMFIVAANPAGGLKVAGSYALFGLWTQSWIPMMAIVMSWYQGEIRNISSPTAFTPEYMAFFMRHAYTSTIAASNMIQQAPYLMFAIMTGSMFALSGMVSKAMPSGKGDASGALKGGGGGAGGDVMNPGGAKGGIPGAGMRHAIYGGQAAMSGGMTSSGVGISGDGSAALPGIAKLDASGGVQAASSHAQEQSAASRKAIQTQGQQAYSELSSLVESAGKKIGGAQMAQHMKSAGFDASYDAKTGQINTQYGSFDVSGKQTNSTSTQAGLQGAISLKTSESLAGKVANLATGLSASAAVTAGIGMSNKQDVAAGHTNGNKVSTDASTGSAVSTRSGASASSGVSGSSGSEWSDMASKAKSLQGTFSKLASQSESLDRADKAVQQAGSSAGASVGQSVDGGQVVTNWGAQASNRFGSSTGNDGIALDRVQALAGSSLTQSQQSSFRDQASARMAQMDANGSSIGLSRDQVAMAAGWSTLANMSSSAQRPDDKISAQLGMAQLAKASGAADMTAPLQAARDGLNQVKDVAQNIAAMGAKVEPAVNAATAQAGQHLAPGAASGFAGQVDNQLAQQKASAQALNGAAQGGMAAVATEGSARLDQAQKDVAAAGAVDTNRLAAATDAARNNQSIAPVGGDIAQFGLGNNTSLNHKLFGDQKDGANNGTLGPQGAQPLAPSQTLPGLAGNAIESGAALSASTMSSLGGMVSGATGSAMGAASGLGEAIGGATDRAGAAAASSSTVVVQGNGSSSLPELGGGGGMNLSTPSGGGGPPAAPSTTPPSSSKPSVNVASKTRDAKAKTPGR